MGAAFIDRAGGKVGTRQVKRKHSTSGVRKSLN